MSFQWIYNIINHIIIASIWIKNSQIVNILQNGVGAKAEKLKYTQLKCG